MANKIMIDGDKLKRLLEESTGKSLKELSIESGFSDSFLRMACKNNKATPAVQAVANLYGIAPSAYKAPDKVKRVESLPTKNGDQISIDDLEVLKRSEIKELIKEAIIETLSNITCNEIRTSYDPLSMTYNASIKIKKEAL